MSVVPHFAVDWLAGWFLLLMAVTGVSTLVYLPGYLRHLRHDPRIFWGSLALLLSSMAMVVCATEAVTFLVSWELMSLSSFMLCATDHRSRETRNASIVYLGATRLGTGCLAAGFLWAQACSGSWRFVDWHLSGTAALGAGMLLLIGCGVKAGSWPFHLWLPIAHPAAPAPVSALLSGVMVKIAVCAMMRFFVVSASFAHPALGVTTLALGAISAFWGIAFALLQHDLKRLLAYSTVENIGLIMLGLGGAMVARDQGLGAVAVVCFGGSLFHVLNHGLFKSLLFLGAGAIDCAAGTRDLEKLGGLGARMPFTFACFVLGSAAICGLPPLNGFASEWLLYQAALLFGVHAAAPGTRFLGLLSLGWIALSGAMALACFTKACGVAFLGLPRSEQAAGAREVSRGMRVAQAILALGCVLAGLGAPFLLHVLTPLLATFDGGRASLESFWNLPLLSMTAILCVTAAIAGLWLRAGTVRRYQTWECGFGPLTHRMQVTSSSYVQPIARLFRTLFRYGVHLQIEGSNRRLFPEEIRVEPEASGGLEWTLYRPLLRAFDWLGELIVQLQAGSLHLYLLTMFATLLVMLYVGGRP